MLEQRQHRNIISRGLPKTGQTISYAAGDDGIYEDGWWLRRMNTNNRTRFRIVTLGGDDVVIDRATKLMWAREYDGAGCNNGAAAAWAAAVAYCLGLTFAGFADWRLPNAQELFSIFYCGATPFIWPNFTIDPGECRYWTSTTDISDTDMAFYADHVNAPGLHGRPKDDPLNLRAVRSWY